MFKIVRKYYGYVVVNESLNTHAHLPNRKGCKILIGLIKRGDKIRDPYLRKAARRLLNQ